MASSGGKSLAVGHISGFQIDPNKTQNMKAYCCFLPDDIVVSY